MLVSLPFPDFNTRKPKEEDNKAAEQIVNEKMVMEQRWIQKCSNSQSVQVVEDSRLVSPPFPDLDPREPRDEGQAKEEDNEEEEKLIISNEVMMKQRWIQKCSSSHSIQAVEDSMRVSPPFPDLDTREPREKEEEEEKLIVSKEKDNEEEAKLTINKQVVMKERWIQYYSSSHKILLVGEGDFSFSASLARAFGSATNMIATSLDSKDVVTKNYKEAKSNLEKLERLGACILHGVDATKMKLHTDLQMRKFDRIIFNFPHAGFHGREDDDHMIRMHKCLLYGFFENASGMLCADGETHVNHKITVPFCYWNLEELASQNSLALIAYVDFKKNDYPGYNNKRGAGSRCDEPFPLGECSTFKFSFSPTAKKMCRVANRPVSTHRPQQLQNIPISMLLPHQLPWFQLPPPASMGFRYPQTNFIANVNDVPGYLGLPSSISDSHNCFRCFHGHFNNGVGTFEKTDYDVGYFVPEELRLGYARYMAETLGRTNWNGHIYH